MTDTAAKDQAIQNGVWLAKTAQRLLTELIEGRGEDELKETRDTLRMQLSNFIVSARKAGHKDC